MSGTAVFVRSLSGWQGSVNLYLIDPPVTDSHGNECRHVVASANNTFDHGPETMVFASDAEGQVSDWGDLGAVRGLDHAAALRSAGYEVQA